MRNIIRRLLKIEPGISLWQWAWDRISNNWTAIISVLGGGGVMSYLAAITGWLNAWGPVAWGAIGVTTALILYIVLILLGYVQSVRTANLARAALDESMSKTPDRINTLNRQFNNLVISVSSLYVPYAPVLEAKQFFDCDFIGPGIFIFTDKCQLISDNFVYCNYIVVTREQGNVTGATAFLSSRFERCRFVNVTIIMLPEMAFEMQKYLPIQGKFLGFPIGGQTDSPIIGPTS